MIFVRSWDSEGLGRTWKDSEEVQNVQNPSFDAGHPWTIEGERMVADQEQAAAVCTVPRKRSYKQNTNNFISVGKFWKRRRVLFSKSTASFGNVNRIGKCRRNIVKQFLRFLRASAYWNECWRTVYWYVQTFKPHWRESRTWEGLVLCAIEA